MTEKTALHLDFETYCDLDLKKVGLYRYVHDPSFRIMCVAWKLADWGTPAVQIFPLEGGTLPEQLMASLADPEVQGHAWNAAFETAVLDVWGFTPANPLSCTMQRALAYGLPGRLEYAADALGLPAVKNMAGHRLMLRMSKPQKKPVVWSNAQWAELMHYCQDDVAAEAAIEKVIPKLPDGEAALSALDRAMNLQGIGVDLRRVNTLMAVAADAEAQDAARAAVLSGGAVTSPGTQTARLTLWLRAQGVNGITDVSKDTIKEAMAGMQGTAQLDAFEMMEIRLRLAKASTKKLQRMQDMALNRRVHGQFQFAGAGRTGRWSGRGVQVQNLPRIPKGFDPDLFNNLAEATVGTMLQRRQGPALDFIAPAPLLDCVSWSLRSCLTSGSNELPFMWGFDFSQIEARVLAWLAGQQDILDVFEKGEDVYVWAANKAGSKDRQLGKVLVLALGFGMGAAKLKDTAWKAYNVRLTSGEAEKFKTEWRTDNHHIVSFWYAMEGAAREAIQNRGKIVAVQAPGAAGLGINGGISMRATLRTLQMRLPSGRYLYYHSPDIDQDGHLVYRGVELGGRFDDQHTYGGKLAENATQAVARDIMAEAMLRLFLYRAMVPLMTVHDEIVYATDGDATDIADFEKIALEPPAWSTGLPIAGEAKLMTRYGVLKKP